MGVGRYEHLAVLKHLTHTVLVLIDQKMYKNISFPTPLLKMDTITLKSWPILHSHIIVDL